MSTAQDTRPPSQQEQDAAEVLLWLRHNAGREITYKDIAAGVGIPEGSRLRGAVCHARRVAEHMGHRLERFLPSRNPRLRGAWVTRFKLAGKGDEFGARDALYASRMAVSAMDDMRRSCTYEASNENGVAPKAFNEMASAVDGCMKTVSGVGGLGEEVFRLQDENKHLSERVAQLEAQLAEASSGGDAFLSA
ncbi:hypothetical protein AB0I84_04605 [Streptomyces spectabilis]|uniref:hypothetical protein n=1 Tax=Streptomyces spectabilis TaxID=68270 RepID=UPI00340AA42F